MASKKFLALKDYSDADLENELAQSEAQYQNQQFEHAIKGLENPLVLREKRRDIARLRTEIRRRQIVAMSPEELKNRSKLRNRRREGK